MPRGGHDEDARLARQQKAKAVNGHDFDIHAPFGFGVDGDLLQHVLAQRNVAIVMNGFDLTAEIEVSHSADKNIRRSVTWVMRPLYELIQVDRVRTDFYDGSSF